MSLTDLFRSTTTPAVVIADADGDEPADRIIPADGWRYLGTPSPRATAEYVQLGDAEYRLGQVVPAMRRAGGPRPGQYWLLRTSRERIDGRLVEVDQVINATRLPVGAFDREKARAEKRTARITARHGRSAQPHLFDALGDLPGLAPIPSSFTPLTPQLPHEADQLNIAATIRKRRHGDLLMRAGRPAIVGPRAIVDDLAARGVELVLVDGHVVVRSKLLRHHDRQVVAAAAPLIAGILSGDPVRCVFDHQGEPPEAVTLAFVDAPVCAEHLEES